jgi:hypothetical protein
MTEEMAEQLRAELTSIARSLGEIARTLSKATERGELRINIVEIEQEAINSISLAVQP